MSRRWWLDCPLCGPQDPTFEDRLDWHGKITRFLVDKCPACGASGTLRHAQLTRRGKNDACDGRCLNGKTACSCRCAGRCHGRGECYCAEAA